MSGSFETLNLRHKTNEMKIKNTKQKEQLKQIIQKTQKKQSKQKKELGSSNLTGMAKIIADRERRKEKLGL